MSSVKTSTKKVIICDDEEGVREALKTILENYYDLILIESGEQCLECLKNSKDIGLVLLDLKMPRVGGLEVLGEVHKKYPKIPVVMISGYQSVEAARESVRLGVFDYVPKPFVSANVLAAAARAFKRWEEK